MSVETAPDPTETDVESLGEELGEAITTLPEYEAFEEAQRAVEADEEVQAKIDEFERVRQEFMMARQTGTASQEDLQHLQETQEELHAMEPMADFLEAKGDLTARLESINRAISDPLAVDFGGEAGGCCHD
ncbi:YlbF family regulator [Natronosalvus rutilus]|uniref:YlbF family regulator n=1 Tax=Natronosalvus rutilus TaxID=2953753 RepID=A0A9E7SWD1_9EURY|nr:YlbF family regulator [Natronosalvus rutilus]UTF53068.1 YlbF family regulator [Natronosalvus rutilus]